MQITPEMVYNSNETDQRSKDHNDIKNKSRIFSKKSNQLKVISGTEWSPQAAQCYHRSKPQPPSPASSPTAIPKHANHEFTTKTLAMIDAPKTQTLGQPEANLLLDGRGMDGSSELLGLHTLTTLLLKTLLPAALPDLDHVVLPPPPPFLGIHRHLVLVPTNLRPLARPERHRGDRPQARQESNKPQKADLKPQSCFAVQNANQRNPNSNGYKFQGFHKIRKPPEFLRIISLIVFTDMKIYRDIFEN